MAIVVEHTPYDALQSLAQQAGQAEYAKQQQDVRDKQQLMALQSNLQMKQMQFQEQAAQRARAEEMQYQVMLMGTKRQIDMQVEASDYARQKQKLTETLNMINESDTIDDSEREQFRLQVMAKYAGLGGGLSASDFKTGSTGLQDFMVKGAYKSNLSDQLQAQVDAGDLTSSDAKRLAASYGLTSDFKSPDEQRMDDLAKAQKRLDSAQSTLDSSFRAPDKKGVVEDVYGNEVRPGSAQYDLYKTMSRQVEQARKDIENIYSKGEEPLLMQQFQVELEQSPSLQKAIELAGPDAVYKAWKDKRGKLDVSVNKKTFGEKHPVLDYLVRGFGGPTASIMDRFNIGGD